MSTTENNFADLSEHDEIDRFEQAVQNFFNDEIDADRFTAIRLQQGVYGQRQEGVNMLRIKIPGGRLSAERLGAIADVAERYSQHGKGHITTRQTIQVHHIPLAKMPQAMRDLAEVGLTSREACGNTVRNMTVCPLAGTCAREHTDVRVHLDGAVAHFLRNPLNQQLPRKFKTSFSGCESDCAQAMIHDLGVVAVKKDSRYGFKVLAGGGLGHKPHEAIVVEEFIEEKDLLVSMEAIVTLHNRYSDRVKRAKSRIKFLVDKFGADGFREKYREELARTKAALAEQDYPKGNWNDSRVQETQANLYGPGAPRKLVPQKQQGLFTLPLAVPIGDLGVKQMRGTAALLERHDPQGNIEIRVTQDQNLMVMNVTEAQLPALRSGFAVLGLREPQAGDDVVACPGTSTCRLGITSSTILGPKLNGGEHDLRIRVSGCHNGCAQPETGDIGIYGEGRRLHGKLIPHYQMYFGGNGMGGGGIALKGPSVPAARIESAVAKVKQAFAEQKNADENFYAWTRRKEKNYFAELLAGELAVAEHEIPAVLRDHGTEQDFKVLQLGGGECAGAMQVQIGSAFFDAAHERGYRDALVFQRKYEDAAQCGEHIVRLIGQGLAQLLGGKKIDDPAGLSDELARLLPGSLAQQAVRFSAGLSDQATVLNEAALRALFKAIDAWTIQVAEFCVARDKQLDLTEALPNRGQKTEGGGQKRQNLAVALA